MISHLQSLKAAAGFWAFGATEDDVIYVTLPLYHSAASLIGVGGTIELGRSTNISALLIPSRLGSDSIAILAVVSIAVRKKDMVIDGNFACERFAQVKMFPCKY